MRQSAPSLIYLFGFLLAATGCSENSMVLKGRMTQSEQQQAALTKQNQELLSRATALDKDNQELQRLVAQSQQQSKLLEDRLGGVQDQLRTVSTQLAQTRTEKDASDKKVQTLATSMQRQGSITIPANNSFLQTLPAANIPGVFVRRDGDVIRIELPANSLFEQGSSRLRPGGPELIVNVAVEIQKMYRDQIIGVEGHTDNDPVTGGAFRSNHELSVARAMAVYDVLNARTQLKGEQLFVVGQGSNHPVVSNATYEGKQRNRRVELVIYPEHKGVQ